MKNYFMSTLSGENIKCEVDVNGIESISYNKLKLEKDEIIIYFFTDNMIFKNEKGKELFDIKNYSYRWKKQVKPGKSMETILHHGFRIYSFHCFLLGEAYPFYIHGLSSSSSLIKRFRANGNPFSFFNVREKFRSLEHDVKLMDKEIRKNSPLEKSLVWFCFGLLSTTQIDKFMNYYRSIEILANDYIKKMEEEFLENIKTFRKIDKEIDGKARNFLNRLSSDTVRHYLRLSGVDRSLLIQIVEIRDKAVAHGQNFDLEFSDRLFKINRQLEEISHGLIKRQLNNIVIGLKTKSALVDYYLIEDEKSRKIVAFDEIKLLKDTGRLHITDLNILTRKDLIKICHDLKIPLKDRKRILNYYDANV